MIAVDRRLVDTDPSPSCHYENNDIIFYIFRQKTFFSVKAFCYLSGSLKETKNVICSKCPKGRPSWGMTSQTFSAKLNTLSFLNFNYVLLSMCFCFTGFNFHNELPEWQNHSRLQTQMALIRACSDLDLFWGILCQKAVILLRISGDSRLGNDKSQQQGWYVWQKWGQRHNQGSIIKGSDQYLFAYECRSSLVARKWG